MSKLLVTTTTFIGSEPQREIHGFRWWNHILGGGFENIKRREEEERASLNAWIGFAQLAWGMYWAGFAHGQGEVFRHVYRWPR